MDESPVLIGWESRDPAPVWFSRGDLQTCLIHQLYLHVMISRLNQSGLKVAASVNMYHVTSFVNPYREGEPTLVYFF